MPTAAQQVDLAAPEELPVAGRTKVFRYPAADPFNRPKQPMSITVNSVVAAPDQTSLQWTVTAAGGGDARHRWQECLCTDLQSVGGPTSQKGRSVTLMTTLPALLAGTPAVDVIFPGGGVPPVRKVAVTRAPAVTLVHPHRLRPRPGPST